MALATPSPDRPVVDPARRWLGRPSITTTLTLAIAVLVLVAVGSVWGIGVYTSGRNTLDLLNDRARMIIDTIELGVNQHLEPAGDQLAFLAKLIESGDLDPSDKARLRDFLSGALAAAPQITAVIFWDRELHQTAATVEADGTLVLFDQDQSQNEEIAAAAAEVRKAEQPFWGELVYEDGTTFINFRRPLHRDGQYLGFLVAAVAMPELSAFVTRVGDMFGNTSTAFILHGRDHLLAHPSLISPHPDLSEANPTVHRSRVGDVVLSALGSGQTPPGFEVSIAAGYEVELVSVGTHDYVALYRWIDEFGATPWALGTYSPAADVTEELRRLWHSGLFGLAVLAIAIAAAFILGRVLAHPIRRAAVAAQRIGELDLRDIERLEPSHIRELNDQASAFNAMVQALRWFAIYVPQSLVMRLIRSGSSEEVDSIERELTIMFTDVVGFTAQAERLPASETEAFLNHHFALLGAAVDAEGGTIDKYIGDALMAFWGAPDRQADHAARACRAARAMVEAITADNALRTAAGEAPVRVRIGLHSGPVVVGNIGAPGRMNYTVVGDTVNAAQRMETLGKELDQGDAVTVLVSGATVDRLDDGFALTPVGEFEVRGKAAALQVFRLQ